MANIGLGQIASDGSREAPLLTAGDALLGLGTYLAAGGPDYGAEDVLRVLREAEAAPTGVPQVSAAMANLATRV